MTSWRTIEPVRRKRYFLMAISGLLVAIIATGVICGLRHRSISKSTPIPAENDQVIAEIKSKHLIEWKSIPNGKVFYAVYQLAAARTFRHGNFILVTIHTEDPDSPHFMKEGYTFEYIIDLNKQDIWSDPATSHVVWVEHHGSAYLKANPLDGLTSLRHGNYDRKAGDVDSVSQVSVNKESHVACFGESKTENFCINW